MRILDNAVRSSLRVTWSVIEGLIPLFAFSFISIGHSLTRLQIGIYVGTALLIILALTKISHGMLLWASAIFFAFAVISVAWLKNAWVIRHLGVFPTAIFFAATMLTMIMNRPFVDEYARRGASPEQRRTSTYMGRCFALTSFWAAVFAVLALLAVVNTSHPSLGTVAYQATQFGIIVVALAYQVAYVIHIRRESPAPASTSNLSSGCELPDPGFRQQRTAAPLWPVSAGQLGRGPRAAGRITRYNLSFPGP